MSMNRESWWRGSNGLDRKWSVLFVSGLLLVAGCGGSGDDSGGGEEWEQSNSAPNQPEVTIAPSDPTTEDDLEANLAVESEDPEQNSISYEYRWVKNGIRQEDLNGKTVDASNTSKNEE